MTNSIYLVMGVSGSGKSSIAAQLAQALDVAFVDGDDLHPQSNIDKMSEGIALDDSDRAPWLAIINQQLREWVSEGRGGVMVCSALKQIYREQLRAGVDLQFVFLDAPIDIIAQRMQKRQGHFMKAHMLASQFDTLERPDNEANTWIIDSRESAATVVQNILNYIEHQ
ncbi:gluconokinase [Vibrio ulleungensis]|uniref:Gluconokinase n=1 Tax=Vibrio ulleungensis TaxID=2807619 RepID=A0ABS2HK85_9VIBR|nr:gluconokinase [Vibrio ulleungensis]MBM7037086.1 gluconokinase [Vibrio ulleungensis]